MGIEKSLRPQTWAAVHLLVSKSPKMESACGSGPAWAMEPTLCFVRKLLGEPRKEIPCDCNEVDVDPRISANAVPIPLAGREARARLCVQEIWSKAESLEEIK